MAVQTHCQDTRLSKPTILMPRAKWPKVVRWWRTDPARLKWRQFTRCSRTISECQASAITALVAAGRIKPSRPLITLNGMKSNPRRRGIAENCSEPACPIHLGPQGRRRRPTRSHGRFDQRLAKQSGQRPSRPLIQRVSSASRSFRTTSASSGFSVPEICDLPRESPIPLRRTKPGPISHRKQVPPDLRWISFADLHGTLDQV